MSLTELMIATTLSGLVLAGVLSAFLFIARMGVSLTNYQAMDADTRRVLDQFARDLRMASGISTSDSASLLTVTISNPFPEYAAFGGCVTYFFDKSQSGPTSRSLYKMVGPPSASNPKAVLARGIDLFALERFAADGTMAAGDADTKRVRLTLSLSKSVAGQAKASEGSTSAIYVMRCK